jgi:CRP-like cAMP-binding protein
MEAAALDQIPAFAKLTAGQRAQIAGCMREVDVAAGEELTRQGDWGYQVFVVESGQAEVRKNGELVMTLGPGEVFGEIALVATGTRQATVVATSPMRLAGLFVQDYQRLTRGIPALDDCLRETMHEHLRYHDTL